MEVDSKEERVLDENIDRVVELFKLLDTWDRAEGRRKSSSKIAGRRAGFLCEERGDNCGGGESG